MIVEDEADIAMAFKIVLESATLTVDSFTDPLTALNNFKSGLYDLIMIDIVLPDMNGFELYSRIKRLDDNFPELDTSHFIKKPISNEELITRVKNMLVT